jgi:hypothetical protein
MNWLVNISDIITLNLTERLLLTSHFLTGFAVIMGGYPLPPRHNEKVHELNLNLEKKETAMSRKPSYTRGSRDFEYFKLRCPKDVKGSRQVDSNNSTKGQWNLLLAKTFADFKPNRAPVLNHQLPQSNSVRTLIPYYNVRVPIHSLKLVISLKLRKSLLKEAFLAPRIKTASALTIG